MLKNWDIYFLRIAKEVSKNSKCLSKQIGAVLVKDKAIISTGYNGPARGALSCNQRKIDFYRGLDRKLVTSIAKDEVVSMCPRKKFGYPSGRGFHLCQAGHAERNALVQAARSGVSTKGSTLYCCYGRVCKDCAIEIVNAGVSRLVFLMGSITDGQDAYATIILQEGEVKVECIEKDLVGN